MIAHRVQTNLAGWCYPSQGETHNHGPVMDVHEHVETQLDGNNRRLGLCEDPVNVKEEASHI